LPSRPQPEFFVDRNLGRRVPEILRAAGWRLRTHREVYGERDQNVPDVEWLELCGREALPVLTADRRIRYRPPEIAAIRRQRVKAFVLVGGSLRAAEQAERFVRNRERIHDACSDDGPFVYAVHAAQLVRIFPA
jgi:hypothetical protein